MPRCKWPDLLLVSSSGFALLVPPPTRPLMRIAGTAEHKEKHLSIDIHGCCPPLVQCGHTSMPATYLPGLPPTTSAPCLASRTSDVITQRSDRKTAFCCCARSTTTL